MIYESSTAKKARMWWDNLSTEAKQRIGGLETYKYQSVAQIEALYIATHK